MSNYAKELEVAQAIAREAGVIMLEYFDADQKVETKADKSAVTIADKLINSLAIKRLAEAFPADDVIGEEESRGEYGLGRKWFCDPIDGTARYIAGEPTAMFSLGLVVDGKPAMGVAYDPFLDRMYVGVAGEPSLCNGQAISVSKDDFKSGRFAVSGSMKALFSLVYFKRMIDDGIRCTPSNGAVHTMCLIARGKLVGYIEYGLNAYDMAAAHLILEGAGGKVTSLEGKELDYSKPFRGAIMSNGIMHDEIIRYNS